MKTLILTLCLLLIGLVETSQAQVPPRILFPRVFAARQQRAIAFSAQLNAQMAVAARQYAPPAYYPRAGTYPPVYYPQQPVYGSACATGNCPQTNQPSTYVNALTYNYAPPTYTPPVTYVYEVQPPITYTAPVQSSYGYSMSYGYSSAVCPTGNCPLSR